LSWTNSPHVQFRLRDLLFATLGIGVLLALSRGAAVEPTPLAIVMPWVALAAWTLAIWATARIGYAIGGTWCAWLFGIALALVSLCWALSPAVQ
jgi:hypothetical protein